MKFYGIDMQGDIRVDRLSTKPEWTSADEGRVIYDEDTNIMYYGGNEEWEILGISNLTPSRVLVSDADGIVSVSLVTATELGYLDGVTSNIQTQINNLIDLPDRVTALETLTTELTPSRALVSNSSGDLSVSAVTATELGYLDGVTSAIQTQFTNLETDLTNTKKYTGSTQFGIVSSGRTLVAGETMLSNVGLTHTLPSGVSTGTVCGVIDYTGGAEASPIIINTASGTINGSATYTIDADYGMVYFKRTITDWVIISRTTINTDVPEEIVGVISANAGTSTSYSKADHIHAISHGISNNHIVTIDGTVVDNDFAKFTANGLEGRSYAEVMSDLTGLPLNMQDQDLTRPKITDYSETINALGTLPVASNTIDLTLGNVTTLTFQAGVQTITFTNPPTTGAGNVTLIAQNAGLATITWTNVDWEGGIAPIFTTSGFDVLTFFTVNGGATWYGVLVISDAQ